MQFFILVLLICLFVFTYCVYLLAKDDFIFLRRDVTMDKIFNIIFLGSLCSLFFARLFYGFFGTKYIFANPLAFLLFPYFPGLSMLGGAVGASVVFLFLARNKKNSLPLKRLADFFSIAFLITLPIGFLGYFMFAEIGFPVIRAASMIFSYLLLFVIFLKFLLPQLLSGKLKEGTIALLFLICYSLVSLVANALPKINILDFFTNPENLILIVGFFAAAFFLSRQENLLLRIRKFKGKK
ncbi:MAG: prolipoprotein diacylglyceryl transferase [Candidatus Levybacteria bacterium]|nr:prolipoprotein diacylglyceryl transferase [Candidatus Levybacteria bacterium]